MSLIEILNELHKEIKDTYMKDIQNVIDNRFILVPSCNHSLDFNHDCCSICKLPAFEWISTMRCQHDWKQYEGFTERFVYCSKCDEKEIK